MFDIPYTDYVFLSLFESEGLDYTDKLETNVKKNKRNKMKNLLGKDKKTKKIEKRMEKIENMLEQIIGKFS